MVPTYIQKSFFTTLWGEKSFFTTLWGEIRISEYQFTLETFKDTLEGKILTYKLSISTGENELNN